MWNDAMSNVVVMIVWRGARCNGNVLYIPHLTTTAQQDFTLNHISAWRDVECGVEFGVMWDVVPVHPNVVAMWNNVRCRIRAIWCNA